jgi:hypothetical protein
MTWAQSFQKHDFSYLHAMASCFPTADSYKTNVISNIREIIIRQWCVGSYLILMEISTIVSFHLSAKIIM